MPRNFTWLIENEIAGMGRPLDLRKDLEFLHDQGIGGIVSLTETPLQQALINEFGFEYRHLPVVDFTAPSMTQIEEFIRFVGEMKRKKKGIVVHCFAGKGRTGTVLACYLVSKGRTAKEAVDEIRKLRPGSIETHSQEEAIEQYARRIHRRKRKR